MTRRPDVEDIQTTRTEKLLAVVLTAFLLLGGIWTYTKIDDVVRDHVRVPTAALCRDPASRARTRRSENVFAVAASPRRRPSQNLELRREAYRTALDAHKPAGASSSAHTKRRRPSYEAATRRAVRRGSEQAAAAPAAAAARARLGEARGARSDRRRATRSSARSASRWSAIAVALLASRAPAARREPLVPARGLASSPSRRSCVRARGRLRRRTTPSRSTGASRSSPPSASRDAARVSRPAAVPAPARSRSGASAGANARSAAIRSATTALRGLRPRGRRPVRALRGAAPRRHGPLRRLRRDELTDLRRRWAPCSCGSAPVASRSDCSPSRATLAGATFPTGLPGSRPAAPLVAAAMFMSVRIRRSLGDPPFAAGRRPPSAPTPLFVAFYEWVMHCTS